MVGKGLRIQAASQLLSSARRSRANRTTLATGCDAFCTLLLGEVPADSELKQPCWLEGNLPRRAQGISGTERSHGADRWPSQELLHCGQHFVQGQGGKGRRIVGHRIRNNEL